MPFPADRLAFGLSLGAVGGVFLSLATLALVLKGVDVIGPNLQLLSQYFPGYTVTLPGTILLALGYGFTTAFAIGWILAFLRNAALFMYMVAHRRSAERQLMHRLIEYF